jgi:hypothetical protein
MYAETTLAEHFIHWSRNKNSDLEIKKKYYA